MCVIRFINEKFLDSHSEPFYFLLCEEYYGQKTEFIFMKVLNKIYQKRIKNS